jgi:hypothetical protein
LNNALFFDIDKSGDCWFSYGWMTKWVW